MKTLVGAVLLLSVDLVGGQHDGEEGACRCFGGALLICNGPLHLPFNMESFCRNASHLILGGPRGDEESIPRAEAIEKWLPKLRRMDVEGLGTSCRQAIHGARTFIVVCHSRPIWEVGTVAKQGGIVTAGLVSTASASAVAQLAVIGALYRIHRKKSYTMIQQKEMTTVA